MINRCLLLPIVLCATLIVGGCATRTSHSHRTSQSSPTTSAQIEAGWDRVEARAARMDRLHNKDFTVSRPFLVSHYHKESVANLRQFSRFMRKQAYRNGWGKESDRSELKMINEFYAKMAPIEQVMLKHRDIADRERR